MKRTYKLTCVVDDCREKPIRGSSRDRVSGRPVTFFTDTMSIQFRSPDVKMEENTKVWQHWITAQETTGRTSPLYGGQGVYHHKRLYWKFEAYDNKKEVEALKDTDPDMYKVEMLNYLAVEWCKKYASDVDFKDSKGKSINPNMWPSDKMWEMQDVTEIQNQKYENEMLSLDLVTEMNTLFTQDYEQFLDVCYGYGMREAVQNNPNPKGLVIELKKRIESDPEGFKAYLDVKEDKIQFERGITYGVIQRTGEMFFMNGDPLGNSREDAINWLKLHPKSHEYLLTQIAVKSGKLKPVSSKIDMEDFRSRTKHPSQFAAAVKTLRNKYSEDPEAAEELEQVLQEYSDKRYSEKQDDRWRLPVAAEAH